MAAKKINVAIMGLGTVGGGTYDILTKNHDLIMSSQGVDITVTKILDKAVDRLKSMGIDEKIITTNIDEVVEDKSISIVIEVMGGVEPAKTFILKALNAGKSVVTANKELIAKHWAEIEACAKKNKVGFYYEASCVGGVPVIRTLTECMQGDKIQEIMGIINGTTNYILTKMTEEGLSYESALCDAQKLGYAEANPSADVDGFDAMYKLSILSSLAFDTCVPYTEIYREGITKVTKKDIQFADNLGYVIKLLAIGKRYGNKVEARVHPTFVPKSHPLASVRDAFNALFLKGDFVDEIMMYGRGAGAHPTGSAIVSDVIFSAKATTHSYCQFDNVGALSPEIEISRDYSSKYYLSLLVDDRAGVLAKITDVFGRTGVSINSVIQNGCANGLATIIFMTHETNEACIQKAIKEIKALSVVNCVDSIIRVI